MTPRTPKNAPRRWLGFVFFVTGCALCLLLMLATAVLPFLGVWAMALGWVTPAVGVALMFSALGTGLLCALVFSFLEEFG